MKIKFDENVDARLVTPVREAGHEVDTVLDQGFRGVDDLQLYEHCAGNSLILVSLDKDFTNTFRYPPVPGIGIVVLRGSNNLFRTMSSLVDTLIEALRRDSPVGKLWIVEIGRIRVYEPSSDA